MCHESETVAGGERFHCACCKVNLISDRGMNSQTYLWCFFN